MPEPVSALGGAVSEDRLFVRIEEAGAVGQVSLKAELGDAAVATALGTLSLAVPERWRIAEGDGRLAVWMAPDEVLILCGYAEAGEIATRLGTALGDAHHLVADLSDARAVIRLSGREAAEVLGKGAPVDLSDAAFPIGAARRTHLGQVAVAFWRREADLWELVCFRSVARYVFDWLAASAQDGAEVGFY